jgi:hypothetical protein
VDRQGGRTWIALALILSLLGAATARADTSSTLLVAIGESPTGSAMPQGFLGVSLEYQAVHVYTGRNPAALNPVLLQLLRNLAPGQTPVIRIGGNSADATWWPMRGVIPPGGIAYRLTRGWLRTTQALARTLGAQLILGINLAGGRPDIAATEARALLQGIGSRSIQGFEIGNEADLYGRLPWYHDSRHRAIYSRRGSYNIAAFTQEFSAWRGALGGVPIIGPTFANLSWMVGFDGFLTSEPGLALATFHRYPLRGCFVGPNDPSYATIPHLLSDFSSSRLARAVAPYSAVAHAHGLQFRLDEMNSVACAGKKGVSDTFASALWILDTLFQMRAAGVDGVNVHTLPRSGYELFSFSRPGGTWQADVHPEYYGMLMFGQAYPPGARPLPVSGAAGQVKVWATRAADGTTHTVMINKDLTAAHSVLLATGRGGAASLERLTATSAAAIADVTLGGQSFGGQTLTGALAQAPRASTIHSLTGLYSISLPPSSAAMITQ